MGQAVKTAKAEVIIHFRRQCAGGRVDDKPRKYFRNNVASGLNLLDAAIEAKVRKFVFSFHLRYVWSARPRPMTEDLPQRPINPYGESKLMFREDALLVSADSWAGVRGFRYFNAGWPRRPQFGEYHRIETT